MQPEMWRVRSEVLSGGSAGPLGVFAYMLWNKGVLGVHVCAYICLYVFHTIIKGSYWYQVRARFAKHTATCQTVPCNRVPILRHWSNIPQVLNPSHIYPRILRWNEPMTTSSQTLC